MLQTKSFLISDSEGINELLQKYRLAAGASILVSDGHVNIPYEDGNPPTVSQEIIFIQECINDHKNKRKDLVHSNSVVKKLIEDANTRIADAAEKLSNHGGKGGKAALQSTHDNAVSVRDQLENQILMNNHEIFRIDLNIEVFQESIEQLQAQQ